jgi:hypothetical protein
MKGAGVTTQVNQEATWEGIFENCFVLNEN